MEFAKDEVMALDGRMVSARDFDDQGWQTVNVPHSATVTPLYARPIWMKVSWYRRHFTPDEAWKNKKVFLEIGAAMITSDVWINGTLKTRHYGGYQKFSVDLTEDLLWGQDNVITCRLDNGNTELCPPGRGGLNTDFIYFGDLYRYVKLQICNPLHITDPIYAKKTASRGVFVTYTGVTEEQATVNVTTHVINELQQ
jgi:beta-galactosidase